MILVEELSKKEKNMRKYSHMIIMKKRKRKKKKEKEKDKEKEKGQIKDSSKKN